MRIEVTLSDRFYRIFERGVVALESISQSLKPSPEDFSVEDKVIIDATHRVEEAKDRIPHGTQPSTGEN